MMNSKMADQYRVIIAQLLGVDSEALLDIMLDLGRVYLLEFFGKDNAEEVERFLAIPEYWDWFRQNWANAEMNFVNGLSKRPRLLEKIQQEDIQLRTYAKFHWVELNGKRPVSKVLDIFNDQLVKQNKV